MELAGAASAIEIEPDARGAPSPRSSAGGAPQARKKSARSTGAELITSRIFAPPRRGSKDLLKDAPYFGKSLIGAGRRFALIAAISQACTNV